MGAKTITLALFAFLATSLHGQSTGSILPSPALEIAREPKLPAMVITTRGQRLLLNHTDVEVTFDPASRQLISNRPGWWLINYPLDRVKNFDGSREELSQFLFDTPEEFVRNWYLKTPGTPAAEPLEPTGPARIDLTPEPTIYVNQRAENASDGGTGTEGSPLRTISEATRRAAAGTVIRVSYGIYNETLNVTASGTPDKPIRVEGMRSAEGMPVVDGNDIVPPNAWTSTEWAGVYRADFSNIFEGLVSLGSQALVERSLPSELRAGEFANNRGTREFIRPGLDGRTRPAEGETFNDRPWRLAKAGPTGMMDFNVLDQGVAANSVYWASTWVWVEPIGTTPFDPAKAASRATYGVLVEGNYRAFRISGGPHQEQGNKYRLWVNGGLLASTIFSSYDKLDLLTPHPTRVSGPDDEWFYFPFKEGWNQLLFQFDTSVRPRELNFRFRFPKQFRNFRTSARTPARLDASTGGIPGEWITEYLIAGPFPGQPDRGVYVRLPNDANPNSVPLKMAARADLANVAGDYVQIRGFEFRHGAQYQQKGQVTLRGTGNVLEGSTLIGSEVLGVECKADKDASAPPTIIRNNWIIDPGNVGFGCSGKSDQLTSTNLNDSRPGRSAVLFENNVIRNPNWAGYPVVWSAGASKSTVITGLVFRYNTIIGGSGPGIWLDWETFGNRVEGNLVRDSFKYAIGIEASPGPNLIANNVLLGLRAEPTFDSSLIASWDSSNTWAVNNTLNGRWNSGKGWVYPELASGIELGGGGERGIRFGPQKNPRQLFLNNLVLGFEKALTPKAGDVAQGNFSESGSGGTTLGRIPDFVSLGLDDYRLLPASTLNRTGVRSSITDTVIHDFNGLIRHRAFPNSVGAFRNEPVISSPNERVMEIEYEDGVQKLINSGPPQAKLPSRVNRLAGNRVK